MTTMKPSRIRTIFATAALTMLAAGMSLAAPISYSGGTYSQNFDSLASGPSEGSTPAWSDGTTLPGWYALYTAADPLNPPITYTVTEGNNNYPSQFLSAGSIGGGETNPDSDRALGVQTYSSLTNLMLIGVAFRNATGAQITDGVVISYDGEQWRYTSTDAPEDIDDLVVEYQVFNSGSGSLAVLTGWTAIPAMTFFAPHNPAAQTRYDGNAAANRVAGLTDTLNGISWGAGQDLWIRWSDNGPDRALMAVDNFSLTVVPEPATLSLIGLGIAGLLLRRRSGERA